MLDQIHEPRDAEAHLGSLCRHLARYASVAHQVPTALADEAARLTLRNLSGLSRMSLTERDRARVRAYFWSVVRRRALRMRSAKSFTSRAVRESIVRDLRSAGFDEEKIAAEVERCHA